MKAALFVQEGKYIFYPNHIGGKYSLIVLGEGRGGKLSHVSVLTYLSQDDLFLF